MLTNLIAQGFGNDLDLNCAEKILHGANQAYGLKLEKESLKLAAGFGGGMAIESVCGALTGAIMVLGKLAIINNAHESERIKTLTRELFDSYQAEMGSIECSTLKAKYRTEELKCHNVILKAAEVLDRIVAREFNVH